MCVCVGTEQEEGAGARFGEDRGSNGYMGTKPVCCYDATSWCDNCHTTAGGRVFFFRRLVIVPQVMHGLCW